MKATQASLADFARACFLVAGQRRCRKAAEDHDEAAEEAALKRRNIREHQIVDGVHEGCGRRGFGLCPHPAKCNPSENCCVEAEASPATVRKSEAYGDDENRRGNRGEPRNAAAAQEFEDQQEEQASKKHFLQHWSRYASQEDSMRGRNTTQGFVKRSGDRPDASAGRKAGKSAIEPEPLTRGHPA